MKRRMSICAIIGAALVILLVLAAIFAGLLTKHDPIMSDISMRFSRPTSGYPLGTDGLGRDIYTRVLYGLRTSLGTSAIAVLMSLMIGTILGAVGAFLEEFAGTIGKAINNAIVIMARFVSTGPGMLLLLVIPIAFGAGGTISIASGIAIVLLPGFILVAGGVISCRRTGNALSLLGLVVARISISMALAVFIYAIMSFIGMGAQPPTPELGSMISQGRNFITSSLYIALVPGITLALTLLSFNLLGEGLKAMALDKKTH